MRCLIKMLILVCAGLSLSGCAGLPNPFVTPAMVVDSFCEVYNKVVVAKGDGAITAPLAVKKRILANELTYRDQCAAKKI